MSSDKSKKDSQQAYSKSYEENPDDKAALQKAIEDLPVKDYSDYEITVEGKAYYEDALFQDDESLLETTNPSEQKNEQGPASSKPPAQTKAKPTSQSETKPKSIVAKPAVKAQKDYQRFLSANTKTQQFTAKPLDLSLSGINQSAPIIQCLVEQLIIAPPPEPAPVVEDKKPEPNSLFKKIQAKAADKLSERKEQMDEYLGRTLPIREMPLEFQVPKLKPAKDFDELYTETKIVDLLKGKKIKNAILARCEEALTNVVKSDLAAAKKQAILTAAQPVIAERSRSLVSSLERKPSFDEDITRLEAVNLCLQNIRQLINGYRQLYAQLYEANNLIYGPQRDKANELAFELMDMLTLEQKLCVASHQNTVEGSLRTANNLFMALSLYEPEQLSEPRFSHCTNESDTIESMFVLYQLYTSLQTQQLSSSFHKALAVYVKEQLKHINLLALDHDLRLEHPCWCIDYNQAKAATMTEHLRVKGEQDLPSLYIQVQGFLSAIKSDYIAVLKQLCGQKNDHLNSESLDALNPREKLIVLSMLNDSVMRIETSTHNPQFSRYESDKVQVYSGLKTGIDLLRFESHQQLPSKIKTDDKPIKPAPAKSQWAIAHEDDESLFLQTDEAKSKLAIDVGNVLIIAKTETNDQEETITTYRSGHIADILRDNQGKVFIHMYKYGEDCAAVDIQSKQRPIEALITDRYDGKYLLLSQAPYLKGGTPLKLTFDDDTQTAVMIEQLVTVSPECYAYKLN